MIAESAHSSAHTQPDGARLAARHMCGSCAIRNGAARHANDRALSHNARVRTRHGARVRKAQPALPRSLGRVARAATPRRRGRGCGPAAALHAEQAVRAWHSLHHAQNKGHVGERSRQRRDEGEPGRRPKPVLREEPEEAGGARQRVDMIDAEDKGEVVEYPGDLGGLRERHLREGGAPEEVN